MNEKHRLIGVRKGEFELLIALLNQLTGQLTGMDKFKLTVENDPDAPDVMFTYYFPDGAEREEPAKDNFGIAAVRAAMKILEAYEDMSLDAALAEFDRMEMCLNRLRENGIDTVLLVLAAMPYISKRKALGRDYSTRTATIRFTGVGSSSRKTSMRFACSRRSSSDVRVSLLSKPMDFKACIIVPKLTATPYFEKFDDGNDSINFTRSICIIFSPPLPPVYHGGAGAGKEGAGYAQQLKTSPQSCGADATGYGG